MGLLDGKVGLVTGIANDRSYAWHIAKALIEHGATCAFTHLPGKKNRNRTAKAIDKLGLHDYWLEPMDASNDEEMDAQFEIYCESFDHMDFLVHSIAYADREFLTPGKFASTPRDVYLEAMNISAYTLLAMAQHARPIMRDSGGGSIIAMTYYGSEKVIPGYNVMGVAKAALECTARYLAADLGPEGIRVNTISGGYLRTLAASAVSGTDRVAEHVAKRAPLRRTVAGSDVGNSAVYLVSDLGKGVTGENIYVDCGINTMGA
jgi:enoyl-[acyl-carrier protein] reductase I